MLRLKIVVALSALMHLALPGPVVVAGGADIAQRVGALIGSAESQNKFRVAVCITDLAASQTLVQHRSAEAMIPASNQKILTSAFALTRLGPDYKFATNVYLRGKDLVVVGGFDPTLGDPVIAKASGTDIYSELDRWAAAVRIKVGGNIAGNMVLAAGGGAEFRCSDWPRKQYQFWYAAPVGGLNFYNNCFGVTFNISGNKVTPQITPASYLVSLKSRLKKGNRHIWSLRCGKDDSDLLLRGTVKTSTTEPYPSPVNNPPMLLGRVFADRLKRAGVTLEGQVTLAADKMPANPGLLIAQTLTPLPAVMARANKRSLNMAAECIFLRAGDGTWPGSAKLMTETLTKAFALSPNAITVRDGGGLSHGNRVTAGAMVKILSSLAKGKPAAEKAFMSSLAICGQDGTMRRRLRKVPYAGRVKAKTGYITGVSALSGYVLDAKGKAAFAFSIIANDVPSGKGYKAKALGDDICRLLVDSLGE